MAVAGTVVTNAPVAVGGGRDGSGVIPPELADRVQADNVSTNRNANPI
jgi:hypothetical protein